MDPPADRISASTTNTRVTGKGLHALVAVTRRGGPITGNQVEKVMWHCQQAPYFEHLWGAGWLYAIWGALDDFADRWPIDYRSSTEAIALREFKRAAADWLQMQRTESGDH